MAIKLVKPENKSEAKKITIPKKKELVAVKKSNDGILKAEKVSSPALPKKRKKKKSTARIIINILLSILMIAGIGLMVGIIVFSVYIVINAPEFDTDKLYNKEASIIYDRNGNEIARVGAEKREKVTYDQLPEVLVDAIVATEDARFFQHNGFDVVRFMKASLGQVAGQSGAGGASTITMQVSKLAFSRKDDGTIASHGTEGIVRKFTDIYMSIFMIEKNYTKEEILEFYVNGPYLGNWSYGVEQASKSYFGKSVSDLSLPEAALLAGIFNAPTSYNPYNSIELATQRRGVVLNLMVKHGYITEEQRDEANDIPVESLLVDPSTLERNEYQPFIDVVYKQLEEKYGIDPVTTPCLVYTTMDPSLQHVMTKLNNGELGYTFKKNYMKTDFVQIGVAVTDVKDGSVLAINGGRDNDYVTQSGEKLWNRAYDTKTSPGSTAKPIYAYGPYLEFNNGSPNTIFYDDPMTYTNGTKLFDDDRKFMGAMTMRTALIHSRNVPAVQAWQQVAALDGGTEKIKNFVNNLGIKQETFYESNAIGGGVEVSPLQMAAAYGAFARDGYYIEPYTYTKVVLLETDEELVNNNYNEKVQAMSSETAYMMTDMLKSVSDNDYVSIKVNCDVAAKSGTATYDEAALRANNVPGSASAANWYLLYSPDYVISMWYGVDKLTHDTYTDALYGAIERNKLAGVLANNIFKPGARFTRPSGIITSQFEKDTNPIQLPSAYTPGNLIETGTFKKGTEPTEESTRFSQLSNPSKGTAKLDGDSIEVSWNGIRTPDAISESYLNSYFNEYYGQFASKYLQERIDYNNANVGKLGYEVYLSTPSGLQDLGWTENSYFNYKPTTSGSYTFVVKSTYSIFKANMSSGITTNTISYTSKDEPKEVEVKDNKTDKDNQKKN